VKYPFEPGPIGREDAILFIVQVVYPFGSPSCRIVDDEKRHYTLAKKRVRQKIADAEKRGWLPPLRDTIKDPESFFSWAIKQKARKGKETYGEPKGVWVIRGNESVKTWVNDWSALSRVEGLPIRREWATYRNSVLLLIPPMSPDNLPDDPVKMSKHYRGLYSRYQGALAKIADLERKLAECEAKRRHHRRASGKWARADRNSKT